MPAPGAGKKLLFAVVLALLTALVVEVAAHGLLFAAAGRWPSLAWRAAERAEARAEAAEAANLAPEPAGEDGRAQLPHSLRGEVLHPYLGFVLDPAGDFGGFRQPGPQGFLTVPRQAPPPEERFTVAVLGGSVAFNLAFLGRRRLVRELSELPAARGKQVWVEALAIGGYKQPQQLMALSYFLSLGEPLDLVINLDGFNDMVLPQTENLLSGVYPFYPRGWQHRVQSLPDADAQRLVGEIAYLARQRHARSGLCAPAVLRWSAACHLVWRALDRPVAERMAALRRELMAAAREEQHTFLAFGPEFERPPKGELRRRLAEVWGRSSLAMHHLCRGHGIPYFHFLQPNQYVPGSKPMSRAEQVAALDSEHPYGREVVQGYPVLQEVGRELQRQGVAFHDLTGIFSQMEEPLYSDTCCHLNRRGNELLAAEMGRIIVAALKAPPP